MANKPKNFAWCHNVTWCLFDALSWLGFLPVKKYLFVLVAFVLFCTQQAAIAGKAGNINLYEDFNQGLQAANANRKWYLVILSASWCGPCHNLVEGVMTTAPVQKFLAQNCVVAKLDIDQPGPKAIQKKCQVEAIPALVIFNPNGSIKAVHEGGPGDADSFIMTVTQMIAGR